MQAYMFSEWNILEECIATHCETCDKSNPICVVGVVYSGSNIIFRRLVILTYCTRANVIVIFVIFEYVHDP